MSRRGAGAAGMLLMVGGGMSVAAAATAPWVSRTVTRTIGTAPVTETVTTSGLEFTSLPLPLGLVVALLGLLSAALRGRPGRALAVAALAAALTALAAALRGMSAAAAAPGDLTTAPGLVGLGCAAAIGGALLALRAGRPRTALPDRFDIDAVEEDEWTSAVDPDERR